MCDTFATVMLKFRCNLVYAVNGKPYSLTKHTNCNYSLQQLLVCVVFYLVIFKMNF